MSAEVPIVLKGFVDSVPEGPALGITTEALPARPDMLRIQTQAGFEQEKGLERFRYPLRGRGGRRSRRAKGKRHRHFVGSSSCGPQCESLIPYNNI